MTLLPDLPSGAIETVEMHTGGEPVRIVVSGWPEVPGATLLEKRRHAIAEQDHLRRFLMHEPRGHFDMYGVLPVAPDHPDADLAVLFMHNSGWSTMCGHAVIALGRWAIDQGLISADGDTARVNIQCPCGLVSADVALSGPDAGQVTFESVPAFAAALDQTISLPGIGEVALDIGYGGAFYAILAAGQLGLDVRESPVRDLVDGAAGVAEAVKAQCPPRHPEEPDLSFLYGAILTDGGDGLGAPSRNVCVFADRQVDRSPTGSGVTARVALAHARGEMAPGDTALIESLTGAQFAGRVGRLCRVGGVDAVAVEVTGRAHYAGAARFTVETDDPLAAGFLLR
jgi:trans-L-3-hydroxyproline dehydratase